jgi:alkylresorcinol/alkylpyrone synthase
MAVQSAFPAQRYRQAELTRTVADLNGLGRAQRALLERLHGNAGVQTRHTVLPLEEYAGLGGIELANDRYIGEATSLGERALRGALGAAGLAAEDLDLLIVTSVTGVAVPSLDARLMPRLGLRPDIKRLPIFGLGCVAGAAALGRLHDYLLAWPQHTAALLAVELCSLTWPTTKVTTADLVASGLFGDGAVAVAAAGALAPAGRGATGRGATGRGATGRGATGRGATGRGGPGPAATGQAATGQARPGGPWVVASRSQVYPDSGDTLGWRLGADGFRIVLTAELADVVERRLGGSVSSFLADHGLTVDDITVWVCHPGGPKVIDAVQHSLKLPDSAMERSRRSLAEVGNMSSASVLHILEQTIAAGPPPPGSAGLMIGLGPGVSAELVLLQW